MPKLTPKIGDVLSTGNFIILIMDIDDADDTYTWRFLPKSDSGDLYKTDCPTFKAHTTTHEGLGAYAVVFNIFDDINWEVICEKIAPRRT